MKKSNTAYLVRLAVLAAIVVVMSFTPLGYLRAGAVEITFLMIPVTIGAIVLDIKAGMILGGVFGLTSFIQCITGQSPFGATLLSINPIATFIVCIVPRVLIGFCSGIVFKTLKEKDKTKGKMLSFSLASIVGPIINTLLFVGGVFLFFWNTDYITAMRGGQSLIAFFAIFVGWNGLIEAVVAFVVGTAVSRAIYNYASKY